MALFVLIGLGLLGWGVSRLVIDGRDNGIAGDIAREEGWILTFIGAIFLACTALMLLAVAVRRRRGMDGAPATATVLSVRDTGMHVNNQPRLEFELEVHPSDGRPSFRTTTKKVVSHAGLGSIERGSVLAVTVDRRRPDRVHILSDDQVETLGLADAGSATTHAYTAHRSGDTDARGGDRIGDLERLADLRRAGALTDDEFEREKRRLLSG